MRIDALMWNCRIHELHCKQHLFFPSDPKEIKEKILLLGLQISLLFVFFNLCAFLSFSIALPPTSTPISGCPPSLLFCYLDHHYTPSFSLFHWPSAFPFFPASTLLFSLCDEENMRKERDYTPLRKMPNVWVTGTLRAHHCVWERQKPTVE